MTSALAGWGSARRATVVLGLTLAAAPLTTVAIAASGPSAAATAAVAPTALAARAAPTTATTPQPAASTTPTTPLPAAATTPTTPTAPPSPGVTPRAPTRARAFAARLVVPVVVRATPSNRGRRITRLRPYGSWNGGPVVLAIVAVRVNGPQRWLRVRLPIRPNGATGWIREGSVEVRRLRYRILLSLRARRLTLLRDGRRVGATRVVVGAPSTPTPRGRFAVLERVPQRRGAVIGPWALHLTAHSTVLDNYGGGPGRVALHGRSGALLDDPLGSARSHGCVRMPNAFLNRLQRVAVEGTPVVIS